MVRLKPWQWIILLLPIALVVGFLLMAAGRQIHHWRLDWLWAVFVLGVLAWRFLLLHWLQPPTISGIAETLSELAELSASPPESPSTAGKQSENQASSNQYQRARAASTQIIQAAREDVPPWEDWSQFWRRCQDVVVAIAHVYAPEEKRPLLNIHIPQAYGLLRDTVDDVDRWMQRLSPVLGQMSIGQAYAAYEIYQKLEPKARLALRIWNWAQWVLNPAVAFARTSTQGYSNRANQQLLANIGQIIREETLQALAARAITLYSGATAKEFTPPGPQSDQTQTLQQILTQAANPESIRQSPVSLFLVGRTGAGKSSLINTLFDQPQAEVDLLPTTEQLRDYHWQTADGNRLILWDTPGYEQVGRGELRQEVFNRIATADALLLVTPATDPALQMDLEFLQAAREVAPDLPILVVVTQVDRLRPLREWQPPYNWQTGNRPKEKAIREALDYRRSHFGTLAQLILPIVTTDAKQNRTGWGIVALSEALLGVIDPAKQFRLAQFFRDLDARTAAAAKIIDHFAFQMGTTQGLAALLKSPILSYLSTLMTGSPTLAILLAEKLPLEQSPVVLGKLQLAYELFSLLADPEQHRPFDLLPLWPLLLETTQPITTDVWAFGHMLSEYWSGAHKSEETGEALTQQLRERYAYYLKTSLPQSGMQQQAPPIPDR